MPHPLDHRFIGALVALLVTSVACGHADRRVRRELPELHATIELPASYRFDVKDGIYAVFAGPREVAMITTWEAPVPSATEATGSCSGRDAAVRDLPDGGRMITCMEGTEAMARSWVPRGAGAVMCVAHRSGGGAMAEVAAMCGSLRAP